VMGCSGNPIDLKPDLKPDYNLTTYMMGGNVPNKGVSGSGSASNQLGGASGSNQLAGVSSNNPAASGSLNNPVDSNYNNSYDLSEGFSLDDFIGAQRQLKARVDGVGTGPNKTYSERCNVFKPTGNPDTDLSVPQKRAIVLTANAVVNDTGTPVPEFCYGYRVREHLCARDLYIQDHYLAKRTDKGSINGVYIYISLSNRKGNLINLIGALEDHKIDVINAEKNK
jgi:hypothetical protein